MGRGPESPALRAGRPAGFGGDGKAHLSADERLDMDDVPETIGRATTLATRVGHDHRGRVTGQLNGEEYVGVAFADGYDTTYEVVQTSPDRVPYVTCSFDFRHQIYNATDEADLEAYADTPVADDISAEDDETRALMALVETELAEDLNAFRSRITGDLLDPAYTVSYNTSEAETFYGYDLFRELPPLSTVSGARFAREVRGVTVPALNAARMITEDVAYLDADDPDLDPDTADDGYSDRHIQ
ncbi:hypothetical protein BRD17_00130 [Halobacteriales archaeon SW_7_68_16]|nr:MAG: hypothetical protein BRD17_00130 [Halobacteriales archaeon SW_7_68_16]